VVVDVSNSPWFEDAAVLEFFETSTRNLLDAEAAAGVGHHVALSVVGADRLPESGYLRAKTAQEKLIAGGAQLARQRRPEHVLRDPEPTGQRGVEEKLMPGWRVVRSAVTALSGSTTPRSPSRSDVLWQIAEAARPLRPSLSVRMSFLVWWAHERRCR
jgi:hypothetical protein